MHSDPTLDILDDVTTALGRAFRHLNENVCPAYNTAELPREADARRRRQENIDQKGKTKATDDKHLKKTLNLQTYKYHSLDDYVETIQRLGTTDSYSTSIVNITFT
jgi:hypothetical protein